MLYVYLKISSKKGTVKCDYVFHDKKILETDSLIYIGKYIDNHSVNFEEFFGCRKIDKISNENKLQHSAFAELIVFIILFLVTFLI